MEKPPETDKYLPEKPGLRYIEKTLTLLRDNVMPDGEKINWKDLNKKVKDWDSGLELSFQIRDIVREYILSNFPKIKEEIPSIEDLPDSKMLNALSNGWFEELGEEIGGTRQEVLLAVLAHVTKKIETGIYKKVLKGADEKDFKKLGIPQNMQGLLLDTIEASVKSDPLFIRFLAYSQLAPTPPENANPVAPLGEDGVPHTFSQLFPHETSYISKKLGAIMKNGGEWKNEPGAGEFSEYLKNLSEFFNEKNPDKAKELHEKIIGAYAALIASDFPIIIVPPLEGYYIPPYLDPELKVVIRTPESKLEDEKFRLMQENLADKLDLLGVEQFSEHMKNKAVRSYISIGSYGAGLTFNAIAQEDPSIALYLNEEIIADKDVKNFFELINNSEEAFKSASDKEIEGMFRDDTILHELSHSVFNFKTPEAKRLGPDQESVIAEVSADSIHRGVAKELIKEKKIAFTEEQYAAVTIAMPLSVIENSGPGDEYYKASVFVLNGLFEKGITKFDGSKINLENNNLLFKYFKDNAEEIISLYEDISMNPEKAKIWVKKKCTAGAKLQKLIDFIKIKK